MYDLNCRNCRDETPLHNPFLHMLFSFPRERSRGRSLCDAMKTTFKIGHAKPKKTFYVCDRKRCENCTVLCRHTSDISHALYDTHTDFELENGEMWEKVRDGG